MIIKWRGFTYAGKLVFLVGLIDKDVEGGAWTSGGGVDTRREATVLVNHLFPLGCGMQAVNIKWGACH